MGADPDDLAFISNATGGVNAVLRSLAFSAGDELLTTDHAYAACRNTLDFVAARTGPAWSVAVIPFPVSSPDAIVDTVMAKVTPRTRLVLLDHITSPTGFILPAERLIAELGRRGVETLVDGAHVPGMIPLDLRTLRSHLLQRQLPQVAVRAQELGLSLGAPRSPGRCPSPDHQSRRHRVRPGRSRFRLEFDWMGTQDPTAWLTVPKAIDYMGKLVSGGWPALMERNRALALAARELLCVAAGSAPVCPDEMIGSLASVMLPDSPTVETGWRVRDPIQGRLFDGWSIEVPIMRLARSAEAPAAISAQLYNSPEQYSRLAQALREELALERVGR